MSGRGEFHVSELSSARVRRPLCRTAVEALKAEAWRIKTVTGEKHMTVLDGLARREGFRDWTELARHVNGTNGVKGGKR